MSRFFIKGARNRPTSAIVTEQPHGRAIYLAGKISRNDWRFDIVPDLNIGRDSDSEEVALDWPIVHNAIDGRFSYVGPFFTEKTGRYDWMIDHGAVDEWGHGCFDREALIQRCFRAIDRADFVFAWMTSADQYGTLVELGYAAARAKKIAIGWVGSDEETPDATMELRNDMWFVDSLPSVVTVIAPTAQDALNQALKATGLYYNFESPLEEAFWSSWQQRYGRYIGLIPQLSVFGGRYRLDFAHLETKTAIELDGITYHKDEGAFARDRKRDRELQEDGWHVLRFTGDEVRSDVGRCVVDVSAFITKIERHRPS